MKKLSSVFALPQKNCHTREDFFAPQRHTVHKEKQKLCVLCAFVVQFGYGYIRATILLLPIFLIACGQGIVEVTNESYEPRLVIEGLLIAGEKVDHIHISKNFRLKDDLSRTDMVVNYAEVKIFDVSAGKTYLLAFYETPITPGAPKYERLNRAYYRYENNDWRIEAGKTYTLEVSATVEGKALFAHSTTTVPRAGFKIAQVNHDSLQYRQHDASGEVMNFQLTIDRSPGTNFYVAVIRPQLATTDNFIYENSYVDLKPADVEDDIDNFNNKVEWIQDTPLIAGQSNVDIFWWDLWFYSTYNVAVYAADKNYREFLQTYDSVQEEDGNFHAAKFNFEGDGIGYFGSAVMDTVQIKVLR